MPNASCECGKLARLAFTQDGVSRPVCSDCASTLAGMPWLVDVLQRLRPEHPRRDRCPHCGTRPNDVIETGMVGCPLCYEVSGDILRTQLLPTTPEDASELW